eukprot:1934789-Amphidinium_carterae.1
MGIPCTTMGTQCKNPNTSCRIFLSRFDLTTSMSDIQAQARWTLHEDFGHGSGGYVKDASQTARLCPHACYYDRIWSMLNTCLIDEVAILVLQAVIHSPPQEQVLASTSRSHSYNYPVCRAPLIHATYLGLSSSSHFAQECKRWFIKHVGLLQKT